MLRTTAKYTRLLKHSGTTGSMLVKFYRTSRLWFYLTIDFFGTIGGRAVQGHRHSISGPPVYGVAAFGTRSRLNRRLLETAVRVVAVFR
jgi:hypothetical protein